MLTTKQRVSIRRRIETLHSRMSLMVLIAMSCILVSALTCEWNLIFAGCCLIPAAIATFFYVRFEKEAQKLEDVLYDDDTERITRTTEGQE